MLNTGSIHDSNCQWFVRRITSWPLKLFDKVVLIYNLYSSQWFVIQIGCQESFLTCNVMLHNTSMWLTAVSWRIKFVIGKPPPISPHFNLMGNSALFDATLWQVLGRQAWASAPTCWHTREVSNVWRRQENRSSNQGSALISCVWKTAW